MSYYNNWCDPHSPSETLISPRKEQELTLARRLRVTGIIPTGRNGKWDITENADRFRLLMGASKAECPFQIAPLSYPPNASTWRRALDRARVCICPIWKRQQPFIVMSSTYVVVA
jgi:hypothetical protein